MSMSKYTLELGTLLQDPNFNLFDFDYKFYKDDVKKDFEDLFKDYYFYNEIGFETVKRFKHNLKTRLNLIYPYYVQLYKTELEAKDINFLLNKDLEETFTRDIKHDNKTETNNNLTSNNITNSDSTENRKNDFKESNLDNGTASANLESGSLTTVNNSVDNVTNSNNIESNTVNENIINTLGNNTGKEETKLISKGNIGTTSSAQLLRDYRSILININQLIIEECQNLFMEVY